MTTVAHQIADAQSPSRAQVNSSPFHRGNILLSLALFVAALATLMVLQSICGIPPFGVSPAPHYIYQAESFLHGRWNLVLPFRLWDTIHLRDQVFVVYPPFPALLMLPFVALFGAHTSDVFITAVISALNLPLVYLLFEQARVSGLSRRTARDNLIIALLLYFGSINLYLSLGGEVWFTEQIVGFSCTLAALLLALRRHFLWSAVLMGCAFFSRGTLALGFPLVLYLAWQNGGGEDSLQRFVVSLWRRRPDWSEVPWKRLLPPLGVFVGVMALFLLRDALVFGSPLESGYDLANQQNYPQITHGLYSLDYLRQNLVATFFDFPRVTFSSPYDISPKIDLVGDGMGMSVFVTTPIFLFLYGKNERVSPLRIALHITIALCVIQCLLYCWTGYYQFGARYLFDAYPFAFLLLALNERRIDWRFVLLGLFGLVINTLGARQFWV